MDSRREFLKKAALLSTGLSGVLPESIQKAFAIDPQPGTTFLDAEHVVILMQENRSFDHTYGTLQGVRGFNDPRAIDLPNKNKVWLQTNAAKETYAPFRLNIKDTKATWMSSLPHSWENQVDARNGGKQDKWLDSKKSGNKEYAKMPLTMGYYNREDLPFYYALADAFTVCDQNFCSSLTGTTPNRLYFWTGTLRDPRDPTAMANVRNENVDYDSEVSWTTFPERLENLGISWRVYQNEISLPTGLEGEADNWLGNFTDNPIEWFSQYHVRFHPAYYPFIQQQVTILPERIQALEAKLNALPETDKDYTKTKRDLANQQQWLKAIKDDLVNYTPEAYKKLSQQAKNLHEKAFTTNVNDPNYRSLAPLAYQDGETKRTVNVPKGDVLHQFRADVKNKKLPTVSWLIAPENFSDHPGAPWYGAWYISEVMDILTQNPDIWKKTIFILAYDENDGYFDHVPPFVPAHPDQPESGLTSKGIDTRLEFVTQEQENKRPNKGRTGPIGLGFRVPLVIASPWSRGGYVCSEVFDHTSTLQFLEKFLSHKKGQKLEETNISPWRRTVCGDLSSAFRPYQGEKIKLPAFVAKDAFIESIHKAQFKPVPTGYKAFSPEEIRQINQDPGASEHLPTQEKGIRLANALPYELYADGRTDGNAFMLTLAAKKDAFGKQAVGAPFQVYQVLKDDVNIRSYTVVAGDQLTDSLPLTEPYELRVYGPNGFMRAFKGASGNPAIEITCGYEQDIKKQFTGNVLVKLKNTDLQKTYQVQLVDNAYQAKGEQKTLDKSGTKGAQQSVILNLKSSHNWYDFSVKVAGFDAFEQRYAGRVETGKPGFSDPLIGKSDKV
ncbi:phospholipase C, phosphocholine-specific [Spirosoma sp. KCTC 42546]|uniref:phosphocholine-specific phospholipase C n=1 Tax=Spirosoma sp. KCTC 42546 TaxID=2520506 RepID=UPI0011587BEC|nr:phospholipase C, phosphocholine-specific [Spirosoma sp. KCTC 42546]QDK79238.1 phospholipase C, phosphocholine-specific [Spirosoma sp. KCTC 42546]